MIVPFRAPTPRREAVVLLSPEILVQLSKPGPARLLRCVANPLPEDAIVSRFGVDALSGRLYATVSSSSLDEVMLGACLPELPYPIFETIDAPDLAAAARAMAAQLAPTNEAEGRPADSLGVQIQALLELIAESLAPGGMVAAVNQ